MDSTSSTQSKPKTMKHSQSQPIMAKEKELAKLMSPPLSRTYVMQQKQAIETSKLAESQQTSHFLIKEEQETRR
jgi:hypothetical protein